MEFAAHDWRDAEPAPLDVLTWVDGRACALRRRCDRSENVARVPRQPTPTLVRTHRLSGPPNLDADINALDVEVRACFRVSVADGSPPTRMKVTLFTRRYALPSVSVEQADVPSGLRGCLGDVLREIRSVAPAPVVVIAGAPS